MQPPADHADAELTGYLTRLHRAARYLPRRERERVLADIGDRIAVGMDAAPAAVGTEQAQPGGLPGVLARMGGPAAVVRATDGHIPGNEAGILEVVAVVLLLGGEFLWLAGWMVGLALLWASPRWRWQDKLLGTLVWPGGLVLPYALLVGQAIAVSGAPILFPGFGGPAGIQGLAVHYAVAAVLIVLAVGGVPPVLVAIRLLRRARRPELPILPGRGESAAPPPGA